VSEYIIHHTHIHTYTHTHTHTHTYTHTYTHIHTHTPIHTHKHTHTHRYILDYEPNDFVLVYYMGSNDAWDGYGGAFLYTTQPTVRAELEPRLAAAMEKTGLKYRWRSTYDIWHITYNI
jgi:hypothetical protein